MQWCEKQVQTCLNLTETPNLHSHLRNFSRTLHAVTQRASDHYSNMNENRESHTEKHFILFIRMFRCMTVLQTFIYNKKYVKEEK